jgi:hypothetical protein
MNANQLLTEVEREVSLISQHFSALTELFIDASAKDEDLDIMKDKLNEALRNKYPFHLSLEELTADVKQWEQSVKTEISKILES